MLRWKSKRSYINMKISKLIRTQDIVMGGITISSLFLLLNVSGVFASSVVDEFTITVPEPVH